MGRSQRPGYALRYGVLTKLFTAIATLQLIDRELLAFDTPVVERLGLEGTPLSKEVTVRHLLTHTSGIGDDADEEAGERYEDLWKTKSNYSVVETRDFLPQFVHKPANFPPGQGCRYCNCGYVLLGLLIEAISGMTYRDYVRANVFAEAGMTASGFFRMDRANHNVAEGCDPIRDATGHIVGWKKNIYSYPPIGSPDGGAHVTVADLDRFLRAVMAGELLSTELTSAFLSPQVVHSRREGERGLDGDVRVRFTVLRGWLGQGLLLREGGNKRRRQRHNLSLSGAGHHRHSPFEHGGWSVGSRLEDP